MKPFLLVAVLLVAAPVTAAPLQIDWVALTANATAHTVSAWSTQRFLTNGSGCVESNPRLGVHPSSGALVTNAAVSFGITTGAQLGLSWLATKAETSKGRAIARWSARGLAYSAGAMRTRSAIRNVSLCGW
jgi:hypothetical protein